MGQRQTWVVVADAAAARIFSCDREFGEVEVVEERVHTASRLHDRDLASDGAGRTKPRLRDSSRTGTMGQATRPHRVEAEKFSREIAGLLHKGHSEHQFEELVLVAPPRFLGLLRAALDPATRSSLRGSVDRRFVRVRPDGLMAGIRRRLGA